MGIRITFLAALIVSWVFVGQTARAVDNPAYGAWSGFAVGSSETIGGSIDMGSGSAVSTTTTKLVEKTDDHLVVETTQSMVVGGATHAMPPQRTTIAAAGDPARQLTQVGTEDVTAAGKTFSCKIFVPSAPKPDSKLRVKVWWCKEVPGGVVKVEIDTSDKKIVQMLKSFEVK